jgi:uncharacterized repeat protein (TIGR03803 family)
MDNRRRAHLRILIATAILALVAPAAATAQQPAFTVMHAFAGGTTDGACPNASLIQATDGNFYGTTTNGGSGASGCGSGGLGTVFRMTPSGTVTVLHAFAGGGADGAYPSAPLIQATDGNFYGTTQSGGGTGCGGGCGTVFTMTPAGTLTVLHAFTGGWDGTAPSGSLIQATDGNFYGTTQSGGGPGCGGGGCGTVFTMTPSGALSPRHAFAGGTTDGAYPSRSLIQATDGNFYGMANGGGASNAGTVFMMTPNGGVTVLHAFAGGTDGAYPNASLIQATDWNFYGTTGGGAFNSGTVFTMTLSGTVTVLHTFAGGTDGASPNAPLIQATDGNFYGTTSNGGGASGYGTVFTMTPAGTVTVLHAFTGGPDGGYPQASLIQATNGSFYGTAFLGGGSNAGEVFELTPAPAITPANQTIASGATANMSVVGSGSGLSYQWYIGPTGMTMNPILGATTSRFTTPALTSATIYWVRVSSSGGTADSATSTISIGVAPTITAQPQSQTIASGQAASLCTAAAGTVTLTYQWYQGPSGTTTNPIAGATASSYTTPALTSTTSFWVRVSNGYSPPADSTTATITMGTPPAVTMQPQSQTIASGQPATLGVAATGTAALTYQWYQGPSGTTTNLIAGATANSYTTPALTSTTSYWVSVSNGYPPAAGSTTATITIGTPPAVTTSPQSQTIASGQTATLSVAATGTATLTYQWYQGPSGTTTSPIPGATANSYTTPALTGTTSYWVRVANGYPPAADSTGATVTIAPAARALLRTPAPGSTLTGSTVSFQWTSGIGVTQYWLSVGTTVAGADLFSHDEATSLSQTVTGLPTNSSTVYVRLRSFMGGVWQSNDYAYTAPTVQAQLTTPAPESTLTASSMPFQWTSGTGVTAYWLYVGTTIGGGDLFNRDEGTSLSQTVTGLPTDGSPAHVRLWSEIAGAWLFNDYLYATYPVTTPQAEVTTPAPGSTLTAPSVLWQWTSGTGATDYWLSVGTTPGGADLFSHDEATSLSQTVTGLPTNGSTVYVRLWSLNFGGAWQFNDYPYIATAPPARMLTPVPGSTLTASIASFQWTPGVGVSDYWLSVGTTPGGADLFSQDAGTSLGQTATGLPISGSTVYVRLWSQIGGAWQSNDYSYPTVTPQAQMITPAPRSTLGASSVSFHWTHGTGVTDYWLSVGTTPGGADLLSHDEGTSLGALVTALPTNGSTVYVRLWSVVGGVWLFNDYPYTAVTPNTQMTTPATGSRLMGPTVWFQWTRGTGVTDSWLSVGTAAGGADLFSQDEGTRQGTMVTGLPTNGSTVYARLWSQVSGVWQFSDYRYAAH